MSFCLSETRGYVTLMPPDVKVAAPPYYVLIDILLP